MSLGRARRVAGLCLGVGLLLLVACAGEEEQATSDMALPVVELEEDPGIAHVHGLGINPADGRLYVATHFGLWRVDEDGQPERVGDHYLDLMGFTVLGDDHFVASGHPPRTEELPTHLGLIETTDAGESWEPVSLFGQADFHVLRHVHDQIVGWDTISGQLLVSDDGQQWEPRGEHAIFDVVVDPEDPERLVATTGLRPDVLDLARSDDGGGRWSEVDAPELTRLAWERQERLVGVGPDGQVHHGRDGGERWEPVGDVGGLPEALLDTGERLYVAADGALQVSEDDGETWQVLLDYH
jgi:hypothetical protein